VFRLNDLCGCGRWKSPLSLVELVDEPFSLRDSVSDRPSEDCSVGDFCPFAAAAAACCARSFRDALPRFFLSRIYSQPRPNSDSVSSTQTNLTWKNIPTQ
jgi:hypothetical protein